MSDAEIKETEIKEAGPAEPAEAAETVQPEEAVQAEEPVQPEEAVQKEEAVQAEEAVQPEEAPQAEETVQPEEAPQAEEPVQPAEKPAAESKSKKAKKPMTPQEKRDNVKEWIKDLSIAVIIALVFLQLITPTIVREHSMENTLFQNDYLIVSRRHYSWLGGSIERGDIIVFDSDLTTDLGFKKMLVKRIIGIPGDTVAIRDGMVYVNGMETDQSFTKDGYISGTMSEVTVPEGCVFVLGDNRQNSTDSRRESVGFVPISKIRGKVVLRLFPLGRAGGLY